MLKILFIFTVNFYFLLKTTNILNQGKLTLVIFNGGHAACLDRDLASCQVLSTALPNIDATLTNELKTL